MKKTTNYTKNMIFFIQKTKAYLRYCLQAKNAHGLHSPFVFDLYGQVFCSKKKNSNIKNSIFLTKKDQILIDFFKYLEVSSLDYLGLDFLNFKNKIEYFVNLDFNFLDEKKLFYTEKNEQNFDKTLTRTQKILFLDQKMSNLDLAQLDFNNYLAVIFENPWENHALMTFFQQKKQFSVTIDSFCLGFALKRPQRKQHFVLKV